MRKPASTLALLFLPLLAGEARAIDCATATDVIGKGICAVPALAEKETAMEKLFAEVHALSTGKEKATLDGIQKSWVEERIDNCGDLDPESLAECLDEGLDERIAEFMALPESGPGAASRMIPTYVTQAGDETHYSVYAQAFRFADPKSEAEKLFNAHVADILSKLPLAEQPKSGEEADVLESDTSMSIKFASPKLLSAAAFWWHDNADDGTGGMAAFNINMETGKDIVIADLLGEQAAGDMAKACRSRIIEQKKEQIDEFYKPEEDAKLKDEVISEHIATLSRWMVTAEEVAILFDTGTIGEEEEGDYECVFTMAEVKAWALPGAPLP